MKPARFFSRENNISFVTQKCTNAVDGKAASKSLTLITSFNLRQSDESFSLLFTRFSHVVRETIVSIHLHRNIHHRRVSFKHRCYGSNCNIRFLSFQICNFWYLARHILHQNYFSSNLDVLSRILSFQIFFFP